MPDAPLDAPTTDATLDAATALLPMDLWLPFILISLGFIAIISAVKRGLNAAGHRAHLLDSPGVKFGLEVGQPALGGVLGVIPGVFPDAYTLGMRLLLGIVAGFLSPFVYKYVLKKYMPGLAMGSDHPSRVKRDASAPPPQEEAASAAAEETSAADEEHTEPPVV
jgi:hypothetical protein